MDIMSILHLAFRKTNFEYIDNIIEHEYDVSKEGTLKNMTVFYVSKLVLFLMFVITLCSFALYQ